MEFFGSLLRSSFTDFSSSGQEPPSTINGAGNKEPWNESWNESWNGSLFSYRGSQSTNIAARRRIPLYVYAVGWCVPILIFGELAMLRRNKPAQVVSARLGGVCALTAALSSWWYSSYVYRLRWRPGSDEFEVDMMSDHLAMYTTRTIKLADVRPPRYENFFLNFYLNKHLDSGASSFLANGKHYTIERDYFHNKELLAMLTPTDQVSPESEPRSDNIHLDYLGMQYQY